MAKVKFGDSSTVYDIYISMGYKYLTLIFNSKEERDKVDFSQGCYEINEYNGMIMGDFSNYKYVYQEDENRVILTPNENDKYVKPEPKYIPYIVFNGDETQYSCYVHKTSDHLLTLSFIDQKQEIMGNDDILTSGFKYYAIKDQDPVDYSDFTTIYQKTFNIVLSNDGSMYEEPEENPDPIVENTNRIEMLEMALCEMYEAMIEKEEN